MTANGCCISVKATCPAGSSGQCMSRRGSGSTSYMEAVFRDTLKLTGINVFFLGGLGGTQESLTVYTSTYTSLSVSGQ